MTRRRKRRLRVAVLGCGPAGLFAAEGALAATPTPDYDGVEVALYSIKRKSEIHGAQYVHEMPFTLRGIVREEICYYKMGTGNGYAMKVYGDPAAPVSWDHFPMGLHPGYEMQVIYDLLWKKWQPMIIPANFSTNSLYLSDWAFSQQHDVVISTIPLHMICRSSDHVFPTRDIWIKDRAWNECPDNCIVYNGEMSDDWYRTSKLFGHESTEFGQPVPDSVKGVKVLNTNCDCLKVWSSSQVMLAPAGRWGRWQRGVLVHHAYNDARRAIFNYGAGMI